MMTKIYPRTGNKQTIYFADEVNIHRKEYKIRGL